ncbi:hypothetical protein AKJ16_DCAP14522 [Drosera capensis]
MLQACSKNEVLHELGDLLASSLHLSFVEDGVKLNQGKTSKVAEEPWRALYGHPPTSIRKPWAKEFIVVGAKEFIVVGIVIRGEIEICETMPLVPKDCNS